jgi:2-keto-4-pentenoate hydratase/2-oxohepta-3-ene-1,7-dioic acid hydratase in catechol pathway
MRLLRYGLPDQEQPGILDSDGGIRSLVGIIPDVAGAALSPDSLARIGTLDISSLPHVDGPVRLGACVGAISKVVGVAQNYYDSLSHAGLPIPEQPKLFIKPPSSICGPNDAVVLPPDADKADWEVELGVVMGQTARRVSVEKAMDYVAGFCVLNDITERGRLARSGQFVNAKSSDTFTPVGPYLVTKDEIKDYRNLGMYFDLNGERYQDGKTASMIFSPEFLISHISELMTLMPGDIIATGTPKGVGAQATPPRYLRVGDHLQASLDHLGRQDSRIVARD